MSDGVAITPGVGATVATDDVAGVHYQIVKQAFGALDSATLVSAADPLPVNVGNASLAVTGPLTDAQLRATPVPVSGTVAFSNTTLAVIGDFYPVTQPVSGTVTVGNASLAVTGTFWQATQPVSGTVAVSGSVAVTGPLTDTQLRASAVPVSLASTTVTGNVAVTGTFWQATQPVSIAGTIATNATLQAGSALVGKVGIDQTTPGTTNKVSIGTDGTVAINAALPTGANTIGTTTGPTLTKGTQGTTGYSTQDLKDAGRTLFSASTVIAGVTVVTTEALLTMVPTRAGVASVTSTTIAVTSGKTLRIMGISVGMISTGASVLSMRFALRMNPSGAVAATSPILRILAVPSGAALAQAGGYADIEFVDGLEFTGTQQIGITQVGSAITGTCWVSITGFEY